MATATRRYPILNAKGVTKLRKLVGGNNLRGWTITVAARNGRIDEMPWHRPNALSYKRERCAYGFLTAISRDGTRALIDGAGWCPADALLLTSIDRADY